MNDRLRTAIVMYLDEELYHELVGCDLKKIAEDLEKHLNKYKFSFYDERYGKPLKL